MKGTDFVSNICSIFLTLTTFLLQLWINGSIEEPNHLAQSPLELIRQREAVEFTNLINKKASLKELECHSEVQFRKSSDENESDLSEELFRPIARDMDPNLRISLINRQL